MLRSQRPVRSQVADPGGSKLQAGPGNSTVLKQEAGALHEHAQLILFFALLAVLLALFTYNPTDPSDLVTIIGHPSGRPGAGVGDAAGHIHNTFGPTGANLAEWSYQLFGLLAPFALVVGILQVVEMVLRRKNTLSLAFRFYGLLHFVIFSSVVLELSVGRVTWNGGDLAVAGWLGNTTGAFARAWLGDWGALLAGAFGICSSLPMLIGARILTLSSTLLRLIPFKAAREFVAAVSESEPGAGRALEESAHGSVRGEVSSRVAVPPFPVSTPGESERLESQRPFLDPRGDLRPDPSTGSTQDSPRDSKAADRGGLQTVVLPRRQMEQVKNLNASEIIGLLKPHARVGQERMRDEEKLRLVEEAGTLVAKLETFGVTGRVIHSQPGPVVNVHEFEPASGIKVGKVLSLQEDLALGLKAKSVLMAPQPGKSTIGIEIPAHYRETVSLREVLCSPEYQNADAALPMVLGKGVDGSPLVADLAAMPHLLVAGATGSGKSVAINVILLSLLISRRPDELRLILVDPKMLELSNYDGIGHLLLPVVTEPEKAAGALKWVIAEMDRRYALLKECQVRNIQSYKQLPAERRGAEPLPYIVVVIDELCDLMMTAPKDVEDCVQRLAQKARAAGIHLILATQRPSVDVLTGVIKANLPCRISFQVASKHDSRTIIESMGAEKLLGKGDMLYLPPGTSKIRRAHCAFVSDEEVNAVCHLLSSTYPTAYESTVMAEVETASLDLVSSSEKKGTKQDDFGALSDDELYERAVEFARSAGKVSTSSIQRHFRIGYNKAARLMDRMDQNGLVGPSDVAGKPREVLL